MYTDKGPVLTDCGLPGIRNIPFGVHMCNFYRTRDELSAALVPYFAAGLRNNERCIWIAAEPLPARDAVAELRRAGLEADAAIEEGSLTIRDYCDWYADGASLKGMDVVSLWLAEEQRALAAGYSGLRITGNVTFLHGARDWDLFMEYEALLDVALRGRRIVTLCTYRRPSCGPSDVLDVMRRHNCTLDRPDEGWQMLTALPV
jgi:hypothetical protein